MDFPPSRIQMEAEYRSFFSIGAACSPPGLKELSDEDLEKKIVLLRRASDAAENVRRRAGQRVVLRREEQALVLESEDSVRKWMDAAVTKWANVGGANAFHPFAAAVELYGHPLPGLKAASERYDDARRDWLLGALEAHELRLQHDLPFDYD